MKEIDNKQIEAIIEKIEYNLLNNSRLQFTYDTDWNKNFPQSSGIYAIFDNSNLVYIGQTSDLRSRMSDIRRTYNHTFRKKLGLSRLNGKIINNKFSDEIEENLTAYMVKNLSFTHYEIPFGRLEIETVLVQKYKEQLLNSNNVRGIKNK